MRDLSGTMGGEKRQGLDIQMARVKYSNIYDLIFIYLVIFVCLKLIIKCSIYFVFYYSVFICFL